MSKEVKMLLCFEKQAKKFYKNCTKLFCGKNVNCSKLICPATLIQLSLKKGEIKEHSNQNKIRKKNGKF